MESEGGSNISKNPPTIKFVAVNFQFRKSICLTTASNVALIGMPSRVPIDINRGKV